MALGNNETSACFPNQMGHVRDQLSFSFAAAKKLSVAVGSVQIEQLFGKEVRTKLQRGYIAYVLGQKLGKM